MRYQIKSLLGFIKELHGALVRTQQLITSLQNSLERPFKITLNQECCTKFVEPRHFGKLQCQAVTQ